MKELHLEHILGRTVLGCHGKPVGKIEEMVAQKKGDEWVIAEFWIGPLAFMERMSVHGIGLGLLRLLGARYGYASFRVRWDHLDLSDPDHPRLLVDESKCEPIKPHMRAHDWFERGGVLE